MSGIQVLRINTATAPALSGSQVIPVLSSAPTATGFSALTGPAASLVTLSDLNTYFGGGGGGVSWPLLADDGASGAPSYSFASDPTAGLYMDMDYGAVVLDGGEINGGISVPGAFEVIDTIVGGNRTFWARGGAGLSTLALGHATTSVGFFGVTPITRPTLATNPTAAAIAAVLGNYGLVTLT